MRYFDAIPRWTVTLFVLFAMQAGLTRTAQNQTSLAPPNGNNTSLNPGANQPDDNPMSKRMSVEQAAKRNSLRQQEIVDDTARLLQLSQELKAEVDKSTKNTLSVSVVKKAEEIEKLAKSVKLKMRDSM
jgi:hypothetical protein